MEALLSHSNQLTGPGFLQLLLWALRIKWDALPAYTAIHEQHGDYVWCPWVNRPCFLVAHPDGIAHVLKDNHTNYEKKTFYTQLAPLLGEGLLTSNGEKWREQRRLMANLFHTKSIDAYLHPIHLLIDESLNPLKDGLINIEDVYSGLTMRMAGRIFFGAEVNGFVKTIGKGLADELNNVTDDIRSFFTVPMHIKIPRNIKRMRNLHSMNEVVKQIMNEVETTKSDNILSRLKNESHLDDRIVRDEVMTLLLAGHETTSNHLMWTTYFLALHPEWGDKILEELRDLGKKASELNREDLNQLKVLRSVLKESLRLRPPIPGIARTSIDEDFIAGHKISPGTTVLIHPWVVHHHERFWPKALQFKPERFFDRAERKDDFHFIPFARGPRGCIGEELAMVEASFVLAQMVETFSWGLAPSFEPKPTHQLTLRSKNGMWVELKRRNL